MNKARVIERVERYFDDLISLDKEFGPVAWEVSQQFLRALKLGVIAVINEEEEES